MLFRNVVAAAQVRWWRHMHEQSELLWSPGPARGLQAAPWTCSLRSSCLCWRAQTGQLSGVLPWKACFGFRSAVSLYCGHYSLPCSPLLCPFDPCFTLVSLLEFQSRVCAYVRLLSVSAATQLGNSTGYIIPALFSIPRCHRIWLLLSA